MTESRHTYTAELASAVPLRLHEDNPGSVTLDTGTSPHVQGSIRLASATAELLELIDTRQSPPPRIIIDVAAEFPSVDQARTFDLTIRGHERDQETGEPVLDVASDEALLEDFRRRAEDLTPVAEHQDSIHGLVNYVINEAIPGAALDTVLSAADVAVPALADSTNLIRNPRAGVDTTDWQATWTSGGLTPTRLTSGGPAFAPTYVAYLSNAGVFTDNPEIYIAESAVSLSGGKKYVLSVSLGGATGRQVFLDAVCFDASGNILGFIPAVATTMTAGVWKRAVSAPFEMYPNTAKIRVRVRAAQFAGSEEVAVTAWRLSEFTGDIAADGLYFDGDTTDTAQYQYDWAQTAHASISNRTVLIDAATPDALTWKAGQTAIEFLRPVVQRFGLRLVCDEQRNWTLRDAEFLADGSTTIRYAVNMTSARERVSRDDDIWCDAAVVIWKWSDSSGKQFERVEEYSLSASPTRVRLIERSSAYPGPGFAQYVVERAQGRGREVSASAVADWATTTEQLASIRLDGSPVQTGTVQRVVFDLANDAMTITARTTDISDDAWLLDDAEPSWLDTDPAEPWE